MTKEELEQVEQERLSGAYDFTKDGKCIECGNCCSRYLALSQKEINQIRHYIERKGIKQQKHAVNVYANPLMDVACPFLDDDKPNHKCTIYEVRPLLCRDFSCAKGKIPSPLLYKEPKRMVDMTETFFKEEKK